LQFAQAFFRFKPDGSKMEHMTTTSNNTWGFDFNEAGMCLGRRPIMRTVGTC
jgi:hypothetical protein